MIRLNTFWIWFNGSSPFIFNGFCKKSILWLLKKRYRLSQTMWSTRPFPVYRKIDFPLNCLIFHIHFSFFNWDAKYHLNSHPCKCRQRSMKMEPEPIVIPGQARNDVPLGLVSIFLFHIDHGGYKHLYFSDTFDNTGFRSNKQYQRLFRFASVWCLFCADRMVFLRRMDLGVISTISSSLM